MAAAPAPEASPVVVADAVSLPLRESAPGVPQVSAVSWTMAAALGREIGVLLHAGAAASGGTAARALRCNRCAGSTDRRRIINSRLQQGLIARLTIRQTSNKGGWLARRDWGGIGEGM